MSVKEIEMAIAKLSRKDLAELADRFEEHAAQAWDWRIEDDAKSGRLDSLLAEVDRDDEAGLARPL